MTPLTYLLATYATLCALTAAWYRRRLLTERETSAGLRRDLLAQSDAHAEELSKAEVDGVSIADYSEVFKVLAEVEVSRCRCPSCVGRVAWSVN